MSKSRFNNDMWQDIVSTQLSFKSTVIGEKMNGKNGAMHYDDSLDDEPISVEGITFFITEISSQ